MSDKMIPWGEANPNEPLAKRPEEKIFRVMPSAQQEENVSLIEMWRILRKRRWVIGMTMCSFFALALLYTFLVTPKYRAISTIEFNRSENDVLDVGDARTMLGDASAPDYYVTQQTQIGALQSDTLALQLIKELNLDNRPEFTSRQSFMDYFRHNPNESGLPLDKADHRRANVLRAFHKNLRVEPVSGTRMITIDFLSPDPKIASQVVNKLVDDYLEQYFETRLSATMRASDWLSKQLKDLKVNVEESEENLVNYQKQTGMVGQDETHNIVLSRLESLNQELLSAESKRMLAQTVWQLAKNGNPELISGLVGASISTGSAAMPNTLSLIESLRAHQSQLKLEYAQAVTTFGSAYPRVIQLKSQLEDMDHTIQTEIGNLAARAENDYRTAVETENAVRSSFAQAKEEAIKLNDASVQYTILKHESESNRELYDGMMKKLKEAGVLAGLRPSNILVVDPGRPADRPARPIVWLNIGVGLLGGLLAGVIGAFVMDNFDQTIGSPDEAEEVAEVPALGFVPRWRVQTKTLRAADSKGLALASRGAALTVVLKPQSQVAEAYRSIRTSIMQVVRNREGSVILVTSAMPEEGKTTTSINCAAAMAQQGSRVLLVEADMRRSKFRTELNLEGTRGLSSLIGGTECQEVPVRLPSLPTLSVVPAGPKTTYPSEMLGSAQFGDLVKQWRTQYDYVFIDTPPVLSVADALVLAPHCDVAVLVARAGVTTRQSLARARGMFRQTRTRVAGVILNAFDVNSAEYNLYLGYESTPENGRGYYTPEAN
jgi:capsular exopolysaccharide synthesis family protein